MRPWILLTILGALFCPLAASAATTDSIPVYDLYLRNAEIPHFTAVYTVGTPLIAGSDFPVYTASTDFKTSEATLRSGETYRISEETSYDAVRFSIETVNRVRILNFSVTDSENYTSSSTDSNLLVKNVSAGAYDITLQTDAPTDFTLTLHPHTWELPKNPDGLLLVYPDDEFSPTQLDQIDRFLNDGGNLLSISNRTLSKRYGVLFNSYMASPKLTPTDVNLGLGGFAGKMLDTFEYDSTPRECYIKNFIPFTDQFLLSRFTCLSENGLHNITFASKSLFDAEYDGHSAENVALLTNHINAALALPRPTSLPVSPRDAESQEASMSLMLAPYASFLKFTLFLLCALILFILYPRTLEALYSLLFRDLNEIESMTLKDMALRWQNKLVKLRTFIRIHPLPFAGAIVVLFLFFHSLPLIQRSPLWSLAWTYMHSLSLVSLNVLALLIFVALFWALPGRLSSLATTFRDASQIIGLKLSKTQHLLLFVSFWALASLWIFQTFFSATFSTFFTVLLFCMGLFTYFASKEIPHPVPRSIHFSYLCFAFILGSLPLIVFFASFLPMFSFQKFDASAHFSQGQNFEKYDEVQLLNSRFKNTRAWLLPEGSLLLDGPVSVHIQLPASLKADALSFFSDGLSNRTLYSNVASPQPYRGDPFIVPALSEGVSPVKHWDDGIALTLLRKVSAPILKDKGAGARDWKDFIKRTANPNSFFNLILNSAFDPHAFVRDRFSASSDQTVYDFDLNVDSDQTLFFTPINRVLDLEILLGNSNFYSGKFALKNWRNEIVNIIPFEAPTDQKASLHFTVKDLDPGIYSFSFDLLCGTNCNTSQPFILIDSLSLSSSRLTIFDSSLTASNARFRFYPLAAKIVMPSDSSYFSPTLYDADGQVVAPADYPDALPDKPMDLAFYEEENSVRFSHPLLFSPTPESWFNPFLFRFTDRPQYSDYWVVENYSIPKKSGTSLIHSVLPLSLVSSDSSFKFELTPLDFTKEDWFVIHNFGLELNSTLDQ